MEKEIEEVQTINKIMKVLEHVFEITRQELGVIGQIGDRRDDDQTARVFLEEARTLLEKEKPSKRYASLAVTKIVGAEVVYHQLFGKHNVDLVFNRGRLGATSPAEDECIGTWQRAVKALCDQENVKLSVTPRRINIDDFNDFLINNGV